MADKSKEIMQRTCSRLIRALPCEEYELFFNADNQYDSKSRISYSPEKFLSRAIEIAIHFHWYKAVYFRPNDCRYIFIDDLTSLKVEILKLKYRARAIVESSPGNFQVWLYLNVQEQNQEKCTSLAETLCFEFEGDRRACKNK